jgi:hypothetical protein
LYFFDLFRAERSRRLDQAGEGLKQLSNIP